MLNNEAGNIVVMDPVAVALLTRSPAGPVVKMLVVRGERVQMAARAQVRMGHVGGGVQGTGGRGNLRDSIVKRLVLDEPGFVTMRVGSDDPIALLHHEGTKPHVILPVNKQSLAFMMPQGGMVFAKRVNHPGTKPNHYLTDNLYLALVP